MSQSLDAKMPKDFNFFVGGSFLGSFAVEPRVSQECAKSEPRSELNSEPAVL